MKSKKHIDRLFKEQFKHLDVTPPPVVWENISAALQKEKAPKRVAPIWYKLAGVAATLLIFLGIGSFFYNAPSGVEITSEDTLPIENFQAIQPNDLTITQDSQNKGIVKKSNDVKMDAGSDVALDKQKALDASENIMNPQVADAKSSEQKRREAPLSNLDSDIAQNIPQQKETVETTHPENQKDEKITIPLFVEKDAVVSTEIKEDDKKMSLLDYIAQREEDAPAINQPSSDSRWQVSPNFAPVYYNTLGNGSSIDPQFSNNSKSGDINYSYGINVSYAINDKLSVRTGLNMLDLSYTTNNIEFAVAEAADGLRSINYKSSNYVVAVGNPGTLPLPSSTLPTVTENGDIIVPRNGIIPGTMQQELNYLEVPLELKYTLSNNRIGLNFIGGLSTLLLSNNRVNVMSDGFRSEIGSANNLNNVSFSTNLGLGFDYKFTRRFVINLEPTFKYQLNAYNDSDIDFKPYIFGVYSGFSYKF